MTLYVKRDGAWVEKTTGEPMSMPERQVSAPMVWNDIPEYASPIDGRPITSRSHRREDLKRNNCVEYEPSLSPTKGKFRNPEFCKKHGLPLSED